MTLPVNPLDDPNSGVDLPDDGWRPPTLRDTIAASGRLGVEAAEAVAYGALTVRCNPALVNTENPPVIAPCCGRKKTADKLVEVAPGGPLLCDSCRRIAHREGTLTREAIIDAHGGPESAKEIARHVARERKEP